MKGELYYYKGQFLTQAEIANLEKINRSTLSDWYKKTNDMVLAVEGAKKSLAQRNIEYNKEVLSLKAISEKENVKFESLKKYYYETNDIYKAVELTKEAQLKRNGSIDYNGKMMTITSISALEGLDHHALGKYYEKTKNIYEAIKLAKEAKLKHNGTIEYNGTMMTITAIANIENLKKETLKEYYDLYGDIYKAVFITKESKLKRKQALIRGKLATYKQLSIAFGVSVLEIEKMLENGVPLETLEKKNKQNINKEQKLIYDEKSLYKYCLDNSYNYWVIYYLIKVYGKQPEEAIKEYINNGQLIPAKWIYEKYGLLFKHLTLSFGIDSNRIVKIMKENDCGIEEAINHLIFVSNNDKTDFKKAEIDWMEDLYAFLKDIKQEEYEEVIKSFFVTEREIKFIKEKNKIISNINRKMLLFEIAEILDEWSVDDILEIMGLYEITEEEKMEIVLYLYSPFREKVLDHTVEYNNRKSHINEIIINKLKEKNDILHTNDLTEEEKIEIVKKQEMLSKILDIQKTSPFIR